LKKKDGAFSNSMDDNRYAVKVDLVYASNSWSSAWGNDFWDGISDLGAVNRARKGAQAPFFTSRDWTAFREFEYMNQASSGKVMQNTHGVWSSYQPWVRFPDQELLFYTAISLLPELKSEHMIHAIARESWEIGGFRGFMVRNTKLVRPVLQLMKLGEFQHPDAEVLIDYWDDWLSYPRTKSWPYEIEL
jgi:hypothetical protein